MRFLQQSNKVFLFCLPENEPYLQGFMVKHYDPFLNSFGEKEKSIYVSWERDFSYEKPHTHQYLKRFWITAVITWVDQDFEC